MNKKTMDDINVKNKTVLLRCDFNVPIQNKQITDDNRIVKSLPTILALMEQNAKIILCSHMGKPKNQEDEFSLKPVAKRLSSYLNKEILFSKEKDVVNEKVKEMVKNMQPKDILLLENTRFRKEETKNDDAFAKELADLADVFIMDAFGACHRAHVSTAGVAKYIPESALGKLVVLELAYLDEAVNRPKRPFTAILGGAKVSDKIEVIKRLLDKADTILIGGAMAYTFFYAKGNEVGLSLLEADKADLAREILEEAKKKHVKFLLPVDTVVTKEFKNDTSYRTTDANKIEHDEMGMDIGEKTREMFAKEIKQSKTVFWNGPMGVFEMDHFNKGTLFLAKALAETDCISIIGGGDSAAAVNLLGYGEKMSHISTGGGASLEFLEGKKLPGIEAIQNLP